jgi:hypothetical protein
MLVMAVDDKNMTVEEFGKVSLLEMQLSLLVKSEMQLHLMCMQRLQKKLCPYLVQDCERINVDEDLILTRQKTYNSQIWLGF